MNPRYGQLLATLLVALTWAGFGMLRFDQGLDLSAQGTWVLGASLEATSTAVHSVMDTGDGPLRYQLLGAWMRMTGPSFGSAAQFQIGLHALLGALLFAWARPRGRVATLLSQIVLFAVAPLPFAAAFSSLTLLCAGLLGPRARPGTVTGVLLAGLLTLDGLWFLVTGGILLASAPTRRSLRSGVAGFAAGLALVLAHALASQATTATLANAFAGPWTHTFQSAARLPAALVGGAWLDLPFAGLGTGETLDPGWPGHGLTRAWSLRLAALLVLATPFLLLRSRARLALALAGAALVLAFARGDLPTLALATALSVLAGSAVMPGRMPMRRAWLGLALVATSVGVAENGWLALNRGRDSLVSWDDDRVGVRLERARATSLDAAIARLHLHQERPALIWPDLNGLHFLLETRPAVRASRPQQAQDEAVAAALSGAAAPPVLFATSPALRPQELERVLPRAARVLRTEYRLRGSVPAGGLNLRVIERGGRPDDPLVALLPRVECMIAPELQELGPALRDDLAIGQSFRLEDDDLRGFALRLVTSSDSVEVELRARVWERPGADYNSLLEARTLRFVASRDKPMHWFDFPVHDTAGRDLALVFESTSTPLAEVRFAWNENAREDGVGDLYPGGSAMLDLTPVDADLVILIY